MEFGQILRVYACKGGASKNIADNGHPFDILVDGIPDFLPNQIKIVGELIVGRYRSRMEGLAR
jgi:hypothetical protein